MTAMVTQLKVVDMEKHIDHCIVAQSRGKMKKEKKTRNHQWNHLLNDIMLPI